MRKISLWIVSIFAIFILYPVMMMVRISFSSGIGLMEGFSLEWYREIFSVTAIWISMLNSVIIAAATACISGILGTGAAVYCFFYGGRIGKAVKTVAWIPLFLPELIVGVSLLLFFLYHQITLGFLPIVIAQVTCWMGVIFFLVYSRLNQIGFSIVEAAMDLGASHVWIFLKIILPIITPSLWSGMALLFAYSIDEFIINFLLGSPESLTLPVFLYGYMKYSYPYVVTAISTFLILIIVIIALAIIHLKNIDLFKNRMGQLENEKI